jgi:hypothetical protein
MIWCELESQFGDGLEGKIETKFSKGNKKRKAKIFHFSDTVWYGCRTNQSEGMRGKPREPALVEPISRGIARAVE